MSNPKDFNFSLKVVINKQRTKVLYAEADSDFADVLLSFLTLPLGTVVKILGKHYGDEAPVIGSLTTLYNGLSSLDGAYFSTESGKQMLLNPRNSSTAECCKLKLNIDDTQPIKYFKCADNDCKSRASPNVSMYYDTLKCNCGKSLSKAIDKRDIKTGSVEPVDDDDDDGVFTKSKSYFIITDDLQVLPSGAGYALQILRSLGTSSTNGTELRDVTFGFNEIMELLKGSFLSKTPLTDLFLKARQMDFVTVKYEPLTLLSDAIEKQTSSTRMTVKVILQGSTNKFLFAEVEDDFVEFLFSLLTIPVGGVECLLGGSTSNLKNIENLYRSISDKNGDKILKSQVRKTMLLKPKIPFGYVSLNPILPLDQESAPILTLIKRSGEFCLAQLDGQGSFFPVCSIKIPKGYGNYVKGQTRYMITDDLTVTPLSSASGLSIFNSLRISISDVKELELVVGLKEALSILKASLSSTCALTCGLINPILKKQPKQEL